MREKTITAIKFAHKSLDEILLANQAGDGPLLARKVEAALLAVADVQTMFVFESETASSATATRRLTGEQAAVVVKVAGGLSLEEKKKIRRMGLDLKYIGLRDEGDLIDMRAAEKAKGGK